MRYHPHTAHSRVLQCAVQVSALPVVSCCSFQTMVQVEDDQHSHDPSSSSTASAQGITPTPSPQPPPPSSQTKPSPSPSLVLAQCLKLLKGASDEHKFAGLVMVTKHVPALTAESASSSTGSDENQGNGVGSQLRQICNAVGPAFVHRLMRTQRDSSGGSGGGGGVSGLSVYQMIAVGVLAAFFQDESLVSVLLLYVPQPEIDNQQVTYEGAYHLGLGDLSYCCISNDPRPKTQQSSCRVRIIWAWATCHTAVSRTTHGRKHSSPPVLRSRP